MNRFNQPSPKAGFQKMSFQELAFAPVQLRQREDRLVGAQDEMLNSLNNMVGHENFDEETNALKQNLRDKFKSTIDNINRDGAGNQNHLDDFGNLKREYNQLISKTGALGMSSAIRENLDTQKNAYFKLANERGQKNPETVERNWNKEMEKYKSNMPSNIKGLNGQIPTLSPSMPPPNVELHERAAELGKAMGSATHEYGEVSYSSEPGPDGEPVIMVKDVNGKEISNNDNIEALKRLLKKEVLDPRSDLNQNIIYKGYDPEYFLNNIEELGKVWSKELSTEQATEKMAPGQGNSASGKKSRLTDESGESATGSFVDTRNGSEKIDYTESSEALANRMEDLYRNTTIPEEQRQSEIRSLKIARKEIVDYENTPKFKTNATATIANMDNSILNKAGIKTWDDYEKFKQANQDVEREYTAWKGNSAGKRFTQEGDYLNDVDEAMREVFANTTKDLNGGNPILAPDQHFTFGIGKANDDLRKYLNSGSNGMTDQFVSMAKNGAMEFAESDVLNFEKVIPGTPQEEKMTSLLTKPGTKIELASINSGSIMSPPEMHYTMTYKEGSETRSMDFTVDLTSDNAFTDAVLGEDQVLFESMGREGQNVIRAMNDNIKYAGIAVTDPLDGAATDPRFVDRSFSDKQTANIERYAGMRNKELFVSAPKDNTNLTSIEKIGYDNQFIKPGKDKYAMVVNRDNTFSTYKRTDDDKEVPYTIGDHLNKEFAASYTKAYMGKRNDLDKRLTSGDIKFDAETYNGPDGKILKDTHKIKFLHQLLDSATDINKPAESMLIHSDNSGFIGIMAEINQINGSEGGFYAEANRSKILSLYDKIAGMKLNARNPKYAL